MLHCNIYHLLMSNFLLRLLQSPLLIAIALQLLRPWPIHDSNALPLAEQRRLSGRAIALTRRRVLHFNSNDFKLLDSFLKSNSSWGGIFSIISPGLESFSKISPRLESFSKISPELESFSKISPRLESFSKICPWLDSFSKISLRLQAGLLARKPIHARLALSTYSVLICSDIKYFFNTIHEPLTQMRRNSGCPRASLGIL